MVVFMKILILFEFCLCIIFLSILMFPVSLFRVLTPYLIRTWHLFRDLDVSLDSQVTFYTRDNGIQGITEIIFIFKSWLNLLTKNLQRMVKRIVMFFFHGFDVPRFLLLINTQVTSRTDYKTEFNYWAPPAKVTLILKSVFTANLTTCL